MDKGCTAQVSDTELVAGETDGCVEAQSREGEPSSTRPFWYVAWPRVSTATARLIQAEQGLRWRSERACLSMVFGGFPLLKVGPGTLGRYGRKATPLYSVVRYVKSELASRDLYTSSVRWRLTASEWHKMWEGVKGSSDRCGASSILRPSHVPGVAGTRGRGTR